MQIYYINLARRTERRDFMEAQFARLGLAATRIEAVTPDDLSASDLDRYCNPARSSFLAPTQLCCGLSHQRVAAAFLETEAAHALVLEDDAVLSARLVPFLREFDAYGGEQLDLLRIETTGERMRVAESGIPSLADVAVMRLYSWAVGTCGYVVSRKAASAIASSQEFRVKPADEVLSNPYQPLPRSLGLLQSNPGLAIQAERVGVGGDVASSTIILDRRSAQDASRARLSLASGFVRHVAAPAQKLWHEYAHGAHKRYVAFSPD